MKKLKKILVISSLLLLTACAVDNDEADEKWEDAVGVIDFSQNDLEEISWAEIHLSKAQFDDFLEEMRDNYLKVHEEYDADAKLDVLNVHFEGKMIEYTITSLEEDHPMVEVAQMMFIYMLDGFTRNFYLQSDYSQGEEHPIIIFYDENGTVIEENDDFIEIEVHLE